MTSMKTHTVELLQEDRLETHCANLMKKKLMHEMEVSFLEIWWQFWCWATDSAADSRVQCADACHTRALLGADWMPIDADEVQSLAERLVGGEVWLVPLSIANHWVLLVVDVKRQECRFYDTMQKLKPVIVEKVTGFLHLLKRKPELAWLPTDLEKQRKNHCRQGADLACGYYVLWFMEEEWRLAHGERPMHRGHPEPGAVVKRLLQIAQNLVPMEKRLQSALKAGEVELVDEPNPVRREERKADVDLQATLEETVSAPVGVPAEFTLEAFGGDLEHWATNIVEILTEQHRADVEKVKKKYAVAGPGCRRCKQSSCDRCHWPKTVRYWRNLETQGRLAEGYADSAKTQVMKRGASAVLEQ